MLSAQTAKLSSKQSWFLHLGYCNFISLVLATVTWPVLYLFSILLLRGIVALHFKGNQPVFDSFISVISDISCVSWTWYICNTNSFSSSETLSKMLFYSCLQNLTVINLLICKNCSSLLLTAATLCTPSVFICYAFHILNSFDVWVFTPLKQVFV